MLRRISAFWRPKAIPPFPPAFRFGVATADHQCEGYVKGLDDIRDAWEHVRGQTLRGEATDFWARYPEDIELAAAMGCKAFRISVAWSRLEPQAGTWDDAAFDHYRNVLSLMRKNGMATVVTLHHYTWPLHVQQLDDGAGMLSPAFPDLFAGYASEVAKRLGDLIDYYVTFNEPTQLIYGYLKPWWMRSYPMPPGLDRYATPAQQIDAVATFIPSLFRAHARARSAIREVQPNARVGANPLIFGFPRWLESLLNWNAKRTNGAALRRQGSRLGKRPLPELGRADVSIAQITLTPGRTDDVMFTEAYFVAHLALLGTTALPDLDAMPTWTGRVGVMKGTTGFDSVERYVPKATIRVYDTLGESIRSLRLGEIDAVLSDDVVLQSEASEGLTLHVLPNTAQPYAAAVAPGNRALLNAVDIAIREFKQPDETGTSRWQRTMNAAFPDKPTPAAPIAGRRATVAKIAQSKRTSSADPRTGIDVPRLDGSLETVRKRGVLRVGIHPGRPGLCERGPGGDYTGLEPDLARYVAERIFAPGTGRIEFIPLATDDRIASTRSLPRTFDWIQRVYAVMSTIIAADWWHLGMAGELDESLCPAEAVNALDFVGIDYYWGIDFVSLNRLMRLIAASEGHYANAPVWPGVLYRILRDAQRRFPNLPIVVVENGCVAETDRYSRGQYLTRHIAEVQRAVAAGVPVDAYLCWSLTSNREWGLAFDQNSDFGLYRIELDSDPQLTRKRTAAADTYAAIIQRRSV